MSKSKTWLIVVSVVLLIILISRAAHFGPRIRLGYQANRILEGATRVQTFRVVSPIEVAEPELGHKTQVFSPTAPRIDGCYITNTGQEQGSALVQEISAVLLDGDTYTNTRLSCVTEPGVIFRIWKGSQSLDVILCFHCGEMLTVTHDASGNSTPGVYTLMAGTSRSRFARLAKTAFPSDLDIQAL